MFDAISPAPPERVLDAVEFQRLTGADSAAMEGLERYRAILEESAAVMNLVGRATLPDFWRRHALDSAQLVRLAPGALRWADLGSGAGLPGIVVALLLKREPGVIVHLVDSSKKRVGFLRRAVEALDLPAEVHDARAESLSRLVDVVTARACAPLSRLLGFAQPWLRAPAIGLFLKGESVETELTEARRNWEFDAELHPSASDPRGRIIQVRRLARGKS